MEQFDRPAASGGASSSFNEIIINSTLDNDRIAGLARNGATVTQRNGVIFARLAEIDTLYYAYERNISKEMRQTGFVVALAELAVDSTGALVGENTSQLLSAISAGLTGASEAFEKEVLISQTVQAFISQMRAGRDQVKQSILPKLTSTMDTYPLQAAISDLEAYRQAGTLTGALVGLTSDAASKEEAAKKDLKATEAAVLAANYGESEAAKELLAYINGDPAAAVTKMRLEEINADYLDQPASLRAECPGGGLDGVLYVSGTDAECSRLADNLLEILKARQTERASQ